MTLTRLAGISGHVDFNPEKDIPSQEGKVIFITGGTAGLGQQSLLALAKHQPAHIYFTGRNAKKGEEVIAKVKEENPKVGLTFVEVDQSSLASVKAACAKFTHDRLDILICNAGIMFQPPGVSADGYEVHFATNHLGHAMLTKQLLPVLERTAALPGADVRVLHLSSLAYGMHPRGGIRFDTIETAQNSGLLPSRYATYGQSKLANLLHAKELARRYPAITSIAIHPGVVKTNLVNSISLADRFVFHASQYLMGETLLEESQGCLNQLWGAAGAPKEKLVNGMFYTPVGVESNDLLIGIAKSEELAAKLWDFTEDVLKKF